MWPRGLAHSSSCSLASRARARQRRRQRPRDTLCPRGGLGDATEGARTARSSGACHRATPAQRAIDPASQPTEEQPSAAPCLESAANPRTAVEGLLEISRATIYIHVYPSTCMSLKTVSSEIQMLRPPSLPAPLPGDREASRGLAPRSPIERAPPAHAPPGPRPRRPRPQGFQRSQFRRRIEAPPI